MAGSDAPWPNLFVAGAPRTGTTSMWGWLSQHPDIFMCEPKEPHYFSGQGPGHGQPFWVRAVQDEEDYLALFEAGRDRAVRGDASTSYLHSPVAPTRIRRTVPNARILITLRDPIARAFSHHQLAVRDGLDGRSFHEAVTTETPDGTQGGAYVQYSLYADAIRNWQDTFPDAQLLVVCTEDLAADAAGTLSRIFEFAGVDASVAERVDTARHGTFRVHRNALTRWVLTSQTYQRWGRRLLSPPAYSFVKRRILLKPGPKPTVRDDTRAHLERVFADDVAAVEKLLGRELPWLERRET